VNLDPAKLESIEENIVTVALERILVNANWLFPINKDDSLNMTLPNRDKLEIVE